MKIIYKIKNFGINIVSKKDIKNIKTSGMRDIRFNIVGKRKIMAAFLFAAGLFAFLPNAKAQSNSVIGYSYVTKIGGHIVSSQSGLTVLPGQEIEYEVAIYNTSAVSNVPNRVVKIEMPYYADFYNAITAQGSVSYIQGDTFIRWTLPTLAPQGATPAAPIAKLTYTLVASQDCYALNASCPKTIAGVDGIYTNNVLGDYFYYVVPPLPNGAHPGGFSTTPTAVSINTAAFMATCTSQYRVYVYLEDKTTGAAVPLSDIKADFPFGAKFYDTINTATGTTIPASVEYTSFPKTTASKKSYYALSASNNCWQKFYVNVLDTSNIVFCAGATLADARVWASDWDALVANSGSWNLGAEVIPDLTTRSLTLADTNKMLTYKANFLCNNAVITSNQVKIIVHDKPLITQFNPTSTYCLYNDLFAKVLVNKNDDTVRYVWTFGGNVIGGNADSVKYPNLQLTDNGKWLKVVISNSCGSVADSVQITVNALPIVSITETNPQICLKESLALTGNPSGVGGTWKSLNTSVATVSSTGVVTGVSIGSALIRYIYISGVGCTDSADVNVTINPKPFIKNKTATICSGSAFTVTPANGGTDTVPAGTTYTWTVAANTNITGYSAQGTGQTSISQTLVNHSNMAQTITYTVTPVSGAGITTCTGSTFTITVTVNPEPIIKNKLDTICSGGTFTVLPVNGQNGDTLSANTIYTWAIASNPNITGASNVNTYKTNISQTLTNTSNSVQAIVYTVTPKSVTGTDTCRGADFTITVTVNPKATISDTAVTICSGNTFTVTPINGGGSGHNNIVPTNTKYTWTVSTVATDSITGSSNQSVLQNNISQTLTNTSVSVKTITYTVIPFSIMGTDTCSGAAFAITVKVNPSPKLNSVKTDAICSAVPYAYTATSLTTGTTFSWTRAAVTGISNAAGSGSSASINETLINTTASNTDVKYIFTLTANGCTNTDTLTVTVYPKPVLTSSTTIADICSGGSLSYTINSNVSGTTYAWSRAAVLGITPTTASGTGNISEPIIESSNPNPTTITYKIVMTTPSGCVDTAYVTAKINASQALTLTSPNTMPTICSGSAATYTATSATTGAAFSWVRQPIAGIVPAPSGTATNSNIVNEVLKNTMSAPITVTYTFTLSANNCSNTQTVTVTVNPEPIIKNKLDTICSGGTFTVLPVNGQNGDTLSANTIYTWAVASNPNITGASNVNTYKTNISQTLTNTSNSVQAIVYTVTPKSVTGTDTCRGADFTITVTVNPKATITDTAVTICSGNTFTVTPVNGGGSGHNNIVPTNTKYTWTVSANSSITGASNVNTYQTNISQALTNSTNVAQTITYTVTPFSAVGTDTCPGAAFNITVTVDPKPSITDTTITICSGGQFTITPINGGGTLHNNIVPSGTTYTWLQPSSANIAGATAGSAQSTINQTLTNNTNINQTITYTVTPASGGCTGATFTITVTVEPTPVIAAKTAAICSGETFTVTPANSGGDIVPANTTYTWTVLTKDAGITGDSAVIVPKNTISQTLKNTTFVVQTITYRVTPVSGNCTGTPFTVTVTVNPLPQIIIGNNAALCVRDTNTLTVTYAGGTWKSLNPTIATVNPTTGLVTGISGGNATIRYTVSTPNGCKDSLDVQVTIKPLPVLSILGSNSICMGTTTQLSSSGEAGTWSSTNNSVATVDNSGLVTGIATGTARFIFTSSVTGCSDTTATAVTVGTFPSVDPITATKTATCEGTNIVLSCSPAGGVWSLSNQNAAIIGSNTGTSVTINGTTIGQVYVTYTLGGGTCQSKSTYLLKIIPATPPTIIIGFER